MNYSFFNQNTSKKKGLVEVRFCWAAGILYGVEIIHSRPLRVTERLSRCFNVNMSDFYTQSAHCHTLDLTLLSRFIFMLLHRTHTLCHCHSLMFIVHFNKVRQIVSNVLSFDLLPKQSIDKCVLMGNAMHRQSSFLIPEDGGVSLTL